MNSDLSRIKDNIETLSTFNATPGMGITRFSYSKEDLSAREYLLDIMKGLGLKITIDAVGNIRARLEGKKNEAPVIMTGSHIDTVFHGGKFDGVVGVVGGLEVIQVISENNIKINHPLELIIFAEEEGSNFGAAMAGSKTLTGVYNLDDLKSLKTPEGISMYELSKAAGYEPDKWREYIIKPGEIKAMIEMHVEQSSVLDSENIPIGIVEAIAGSKWFQVNLKGVSNHAGATPMNMRNDPLVGSAHIICRMDEFIKENTFPSTVSTVGKIICQPNVSNVIPESVTFTVDIRDVKREGVSMAERELRIFTDGISSRYGLEKDITVKGESAPISLSKKIIDVLEDVMIEKSIVYKKMNSGAVHDSCFLAGVTDVGMIFVPSINGRSHVPEELTSYDDIKRGCDLLLGAIFKLDEMQD